MLSSQLLVYTRVADINASVRRIQGNLQAIIYIEHHIVNTSWHSNSGEIFKQDEYDQDSAEEPTVRCEFV